MCIFALKSKCAPPVPFTIHLQLRCLLTAVQQPSLHMRPAHSLPTPEVILKSLLKKKKQHTHTNKKNTTKNPNKQKNNQKNTKQAEAKGRLHATSWVGETSA